MKKINLIIPAILLTSLTLPVNAEIYKCEKDGQTVFSDKSCGQNSQTIQLEEISFEQLKAMTAEAKVKFKQAEVEYLEYDINTLQKQMNRELFSLQQKKGLITEDIKKTSLERPISEKIESIADKYENQIDSKRDKIQRIKNEINSLSNS